MTGRAFSKPVVSDPDIHVGAPENVIEEPAIAVRAYELWLERGRPHGSDQEDWFRAEIELKRLRNAAAEGSLASSRGRRLTTAE